MSVGIELGKANAYETSENLNLHGCMWPHVLVTMRCEDMPSLSGSMSCSGVAVV